MYPRIIALLLLLLSILVDIFGIPFAFQNLSESTPAERSATFRFGMYFSAVAVLFTALAVAGLVATWRRRRWALGYLSGLAVLALAGVAYQLFRRDFLLLGFSLIPAVLLVIAVREYRRGMLSGTSG